MAKFIKDLTDKCESHIQWAIEEGKRTCEVMVVYGCNSPVQAQSCYDQHVYLDEIKREKKRLENEGYTVKVEQGSTAYTDYNDLTGNDHSYTKYDMHFTISW